MRALGFDQKKYTASYDRENTTRVYIKLNNRTDKDILDKLDSVPNKQGYIKSLVRRDIGEHDETTQNDPSGKTE